MEKSVQFSSLNRGSYSPIENQNDLELDFKVFFFVHSCSPGIVFVESK